MPSLRFGSTSRRRFSDGLIFDAIRLRLIEIGEAAKRVDPATLALSQMSHGGILPECEIASPIDTSTLHMRSSKRQLTTTFLN